jgi:hypothetical protein
MEPSAVPLAVQAEPIKQPLEARVAPEAAVAVLAPGSAPFRVVVVVELAVPTVIPEAPAGSAAAAVAAAPADSAAVKVDSAAAPADSAVVVADSAAEAAAETPNLLDSAAATLLPAEPCATAAAVQPWVERFSCAPEQA